MLDETCQGFRSLVGGSRLSLLAIALSMPWCMSGTCPKRRRRSMHQCSCPGSRHMWLKDLLSDTNSPSCCTIRAAPHRRRPRPQPEPSPRPRPQQNERRLPTLRNCKMCRRAAQRCSASSHEVLEKKTTPPTNKKKQNIPSVLEFTCKNQPCKSRATQQLKR